MAHLEKQFSPASYRRMLGPRRLEGEKCDCGEKIFPPRDICPNDRIAATPYSGLNISDVQEQMAEHARELAKKPSKVNEIISEVVLVEN